MANGPQPAARSESFSLPEFTSPPLHLGSLPLQPGAEQTTSSIRSPSLFKAGREGGDVATPSASPSLPGPFPLRPAEESQPLPHTAMALSGKEKAKVLSPTGSH